MPWNETPPFMRGGSYMMGGVIDTVNDPTPQVNLEGHVYVFPDSTYGTGIPVRVRCVRNTTGINVLPSLAYVYDPAYPKQRVNAIATVAQSRCVIADDLLPAAGVQNNDLFYVVESGPCLITTPSGGTTLVLGDQCISTVAATAGAADAGTVSVGATVGSTASSNNPIGRAMSAATSAMTLTKVLALLESMW